MSNNTKTKEDNAQNIILYIQLIIQVMQNLYHLESAIWMDLNDLVLFQEAQNIVKRNATALDKKRNNNSQIITMTLDMAMYKWEAFEQAK